MVWPDVQATDLGYNKPMRGSRAILVALLALGCSRTGMQRGTDAASIGDASFPSDTRTDLVTPVRTTDARPVLPDSLLGRTFTIAASTPAPTPSATCTKNTPTDVFSLAFGDTINTVTVTQLNLSPPEIFHGTLGPEANKITYHLNDAFAGGTVTLEWDQGVAVAQVTINGSGVPIIVCVRGPLSPQP